MRWLTQNLGYKLLALAIAVLLWAIAQGSSSIERGFDLPVVFRGVPADLVLTEESADAVNVRVLGSRASLRTLEPERMEYAVDVAGAKPGVSEFEVDMSRIELPRGARLVSRSPSRIEATFENKASKVVRVRPDLDGEPAPGFSIAAVEVEPAKVRLSGARSEVLRLADVPTETIDVSGLTEDTVREVRLSLGASHVWVDEPTPVKVRIQVTRPAPEPPAATPEAPPPPRGAPAPAKGGTKKRRGT